MASKEKSDGISSRKIVEVYSEGWESAEDMQSG
jgi:hypothetical protein